jgi:hypothetical protein
MEDSRSIRASHQSRSHLTSIGIPVVAVLAVGAAVLAQVAGSAVAGCTKAPQAISYQLTAAQTVKTVNTGLLERGPAPPPLTLAGVVSGYIIEGHWDTLQPTAGGPLSTTVIDRAVAAVRAWNAANPTNQRSLRLRIESGIYAPDWVKALSGGPVNITSASGATGTVSRWWTQPVEDAYTAFIAKLAAYVDPIPEIREVTVGATMEFFGEIFIRYASQNAAALTAAGFTQAADIAAMEASFRAHLAFQYTTTQIDVNGYQQLNGGNSLTVTQQMMNYALSIGLAHVQFANASLTSSGNTPLYALMQSYGPKGSNQATITFQTMPTVPSVTQVIERALTYGATSIELPSNPGSATTLAPLEQALDAGIVTAPSIVSPGMNSGPSPSSAPSGPTGVRQPGSVTRHKATRVLAGARLGSAAAHALVVAVSNLVKSTPASASTRRVDTPAAPVAVLDYAGAGTGVC